MDRPNRRTFIGSAAAAAAGGLTVASRADTQRPADRLPDLGSPPGDAIVFDFDESGRPLLSPPDGFDYPAALFQSADGAGKVLVVIRRLLHVDKIEDPTVRPLDLDALDLEVDLIVALDPSGGRDYEGGYAEFELGLMAGDGRVTDRIQTRTRTEEANISGLKGDRVVLRFGKLRLPVPRRGYIVARFVPDKRPNTSLGHYQQ